MVRGIRVLCSHPSESEARLSYAGLADILGEAIDDVRPDIPPPQMHALEVALRRVTPERRYVDRHAVAAGVRSALAALAKRGPVLVAIDDVQRLDRPSARVLGFAGRRLRDSRVGLLLTSRDSSQELVDLTLSGASELDRLRCVTVCPLGIEDLHRVIRLHLDWVPPRPTLARIALLRAAIRCTRCRSHANSPGSGKRRLRAGRCRSPTSLTNPSPAGLRHCRCESREALLLSAFLSAPTTELMRKIMGPAADSALAHAEDAEVVVTDGHVIRFTHPLLAHAADTSTGTVERRRAHRRLANASDDSEEQARHLALSTTRPTKRTAQALETAAHAARKRGATDAAAELIELAVARTPVNQPGQRSRRCLVLGEYQLAAGDTDRARETLVAVAATAADSDLEARALLLLARINWLTTTSVEAAALAERALAGADDPALEAEIRTRLAYLCKHDLSSASPTPSEPCQSWRAYQNQTPSCSLGHSSQSSSTNPTSACRSA